jgi:hypothetical protein
MKKPLRQIILAFCLFPASLSIGTEASAAGFIESAGTALSIALPATAAGLSLGSGDKKGTTQLIESTAFTVGVTYGLKYAINEKRPDGSDNHSFPSLHTAISYSAADFMRRRYGWEYGAPAWLAATFVGYSRVEAKKHHVHDVVAGAAIGLLGNMLFTTPREGVNVCASVNDGHYGINISAGW